MKLDVYSFGEELAVAGDRAATAEAHGLSGLWFPETAHNPFLGCAVAASRTSTLQIGTGIAVAFPRSPMVTAQTAWDLQQASGGRFLLGLGTQVRAHIKRRFSAEFSKPLPRMREYIAALRAIWDAFQGEAPLKFQGDFWSFSLLTDFFDPGPIDHPDIPIHVAGVNPGIARLVGEVADGFHVHPFHSPAWLTDVVRPAIAEGAARTGRDPAEVELACPVFMIVGDREADIDAQRRATKRQLGFYGSTPPYAPVFAHHGFDDVQPRLQAAVRAGEIEKLAEIVSDDVLDTYSVTATWDGLAKALVERYGGLVDRLFPYAGHGGWADEPESWARWGDVADEVRRLASAEVRA